MKATLNRLLLSCAALSLAACASGGGGDPANPQPVAGPSGIPAPSRNLVMTDISYLHPSSGDGVSASYDVAAATLTVERQVVDQTTGQTALVFQESVRGFFDDGNTMFYDTNNNTFTFDITSGVSSMSETFLNVMLTDPVDIGFEFNNEAIVISSNPFIFGLDAADANAFLGNPGAVDAFLSTLSESQDENDQNLLTFLQERVADLITNSDFYFYESNGVDYFHLNLTNGAGTTNYATLGLWVDTTAGNGQETYGAAVWGERTPIQEIPTSGTATYVATVEGYILQNNNIQDLVGSITFNFDFTTDILDFIYDADIRETGIDGTSDFFDYDIFDGTGDVTGDEFFGTFVSQSDPSIIGELEGAFFGADADEVAGTLVFGNEFVHGIGGFLGANPEAASQQN